MIYNENIYDKKMITTIVSFYYTGFQLLTITAPYSYHIDLSAQEKTKLNPNMELLRCIEGTQSNKKDRIKSFLPSLSVISIIRRERDSFSN